MRTTAGAHRDRGLSGPVEAPEATEARATTAVAGGARAIVPLVQKRRTTMTSCARQVLADGGRRGSVRHEELANWVEGGRICRVQQRRGL